MTNARGSLNVKKYVVCFDSLKNDRSPPKNIIFGKMCNV